MKAQKLFGAFLLFLFAFSFASCSSDDDEKDTVFDYSLLEGHWVVTKPSSDDAADHYVFDTKSQTCSAIYTGPAVDGIPRNYKYVIDREKNQITLTDSKLPLTEKYEIQKLTANKMKWKNLILADGETDKELAKKE